MYVKWIPAVLFGSCLLVGAGLFGGTRMEISRNQKLDHYSDQIRTTIAVVNQDVGADNCGVKENYSAAIIESLDPEYVLVSPQEAQNGYEAGRYGAVIIFPSDLSKKVISINTWEPEQVGLEFMINPSLPEGKYINLYTKVIELQSKMNEALSYTYVSSLYDEFHEAQDSTKELFVNDKKDMDAAGKVKLTNFTEELNLHDAPRTVFETKEIDFQEFVNQVRGCAEELSGQYQESYQKARDDYAVVQSNTLNYSGRVRDDSIQWQGQVDDWGIRVDDYGRALEEYSHKLDAWITEAEEWQDETVTWNRQVEGYQKAVDDWRVKSDQTLSAYRTDWEDKTLEIGGKLKTYCSDLNEYKANVDAYREAVAAYAEAAFNPGGLHAAQAAGGEEEQEAAAATESEARKGETAANAESENGMKAAAPDKRTAEEGTDDGAREKTGEKTGESVGENTLDGEENDGTEAENAESGATEEPEEQKTVNTAAGDGTAAFRTAGTMAEYTAVADREDEENGLFADGAVWLINDLVEKDESLLNGNHGLLGAPPQGSLPPEVEEAAKAAEESSQKVKDFPELPELPVLTLEAYAGTPNPDFEGGMAPVLDKQIPQNEAGNFPQLPDELTEALRSLENEVLVYDAGNYLDGEVRGRIDALVDNYQKHLGAVEKEVNHQLQDQVREQDRANRDYQQFLEDLGKEAQDVNQAEQKKLTTALDLFYTAKEETSRENQDLLADFAAKLPFSRNQSTLNKEVVEFTVAPLEFTDVQVRPEASVNEQRQKQLLRDQTWLLAVLSLCTILALLGGIAGKIRKDSESAGDEDE